MKIRCLLISCLWLLLFVSIVFTIFFAQNNKMFLLFNPNANFILPHDVPLNLHRESFASKPFEQLTEWLSFMAIMNHYKGKASFQSIFLKLHQAEIEKGKREVLCL